MGSAIRIRPSFLASHGGLYEDYCEDRFLHSLLIRGNLQGQGRTGVI